MEWRYILALVIAIPVILFPVAFVWYLNVGGIYKAVRAFRERRAARSEQTTPAVQEHREAAHRIET